MKWTVSWQNLGIEKEVEVEADEASRARRLASVKLWRENQDDIFISKLTTALLYAGSSVKRHADRRRAYDY